MTIINSARELDVYKLAYKASMEIYNLTKSFPTEEKYDLILTSETIYSAESHVKLYELMKRALKVDGIM